MEEIYIVVYAKEKGGYGRIKGAFLKEEDAKKAAKGFGFWGSDGYVIPINLFKDFEEFEIDK